MITIGCPSPFILESLILQGYLQEQRQQHADFHDLHSYVDRIHTGTTGSSRRQHRTIYWIMKILIELTATICSSRGRIGRNFQVMC